MKEVIDYLVGTRKSLDEGLNAFGKDLMDITEEELDEVNEAIFRCDICSWWCTVGEMADGYETMCNECYIAEEDE